MDDKDKQMKTLKYMLFLTVLIVGLGGVAEANTIGTLTLTNCATSGTLCPAAPYGFDIGTTSATLTVTINGPVTAGLNNLIGGVNLGFTSSPPTVTGGSTTASGGWTFTTGSLNNNGCNTNSSAGFTCAYFTANATNGGSTIVQGGTYSWTWNYNALSPNAIFVVGSVHVGVNYNPANGLIVSQTGAVTTPEPSGLLLLGGGLIGLAGFVRRKRR